MLVCIDIGGGTTRVGFSSSGHDFLKIEKFPTQDDFHDEIAEIVKIIRENTEKVDSVVIAAAGSVDREKGIIISWGQKKLWWGQNIFKALSEHFKDAQFYIDNDANIAALGEAVYGAGKNHSLVGYVTFSSGVGGCLINDKQIAPHIFGLEPAHQIVNFTEKKTWSCGQKGCFESYASGTAFKQIFEVNPEDCQNQAIWDKYGKLIAPGIANLTALWSPEIMIIGGGVANKFDYFIDSLEKEITAILPMYHIPKIVKNDLREPGLYGGLAYLEGLK